MRRLTPLLITGCFGCGTLGTLAATERSIPDYQSRHAVAGLEGSVTILRDSYGVPHIRAATERDAWLALGWVHARDRLFQADMARRFAWGRLSEVVGEDTVELDLFMKGLMLERHAEALLAAQPPEIRAVSEAYAEGMNAGAHSLEALPIEHRLLDVTFEPWRPVDAYALVFLQSWGLAENPRWEVGALGLREHDTELLDALTRIHPETPPIEPEWEAVRTLALPPLLPGFARLAGELNAPEPEGSNNWIVGPERTASGKPIVANDPHLVQRVPSLWYLAELKAGDLHVAGVTFPGTPGIVIGHNEHVAWGVTNLMADYVDLAVLERDGDAVVIAGERRPLTPVEVTVQVKDAAPVTRTAWWSDVGPLVTALEGDHVVALQWSALESPDRTQEAFIGLNRARSVEEALVALDNPLAVAQNFVVADVTGDYAWQAAGRTPRRLTHTGRVPYLASAPGTGWDGWVDDLPGERAPERGYVATANARPDHPQADAISTMYAAPWRQQRIEGLLSEATGVGVAEMVTVQGDVVDLQAATVLPPLLEGVRGDGVCLRLLRDWDHAATSKAAAPAVWALFQRELVREALRDALGPDDTELYLAMANPSQSVYELGIDRFLGPDERMGAVGRALDAACAQLTAQQGPDPAAWSWGALHPLRLEHPFAERAPKLLRAWNMPVVPFAGTGNTVAAAGYDWEGRDDLEVTALSSVRLVMPLDDLGASSATYPGGQSGMPGSMFYQSHFVPFVRNVTAPLFFDEAEVQGHTLYTTELLPMTSIAAE